MITIRNLRIAWGGNETFRAPTLREALEEMAEAVNACGEFHVDSAALVEDQDFEVIGTMAHFLGTATRVEILCDHCAEAARREGLDERSGLACKTLEDTGATRCDRCGSIL
jgi:hypothetical protein